MVGISKSKKKESLLRDNLILFISTFINSTFGYLYHFFAARTLGPISYGILSSLLSIVYILTIPFNTVQTAIARFTAEYKTKKEEGKVSYLLSRSIKKLFILSIFVSIILIALIPLLKSFLLINATMPFVILAIVSIFILLLPVVRGIMQGSQDFKTLGLNLILEGLIKFSLGAVLILIGFKVNGALGAIVASFSIPFFIGLYNLKKYLRIKKTKIEKDHFYKYSLYLLMLLSTLTIFYSIDLLLVKHYFSETEAGYYAAASLLGKVIFFGTMSITQVMFAKVSEHYFSKKEFKKIMYKSLLIISLFGAAVFSFYSLFPDFAVRLFFGKSFLAIKPYIGRFAVLMTLFSLTYAVSFYNISINRNKFIYLIILSNIAEILLIMFFHNSLMQVINILLYLVLALFIILFAYTIFKKNGQNINNNSSI